MAKASKQFGEAVSELLDSRGLSLRAAALKTGVDHTTISQMRTGMVPKKGIIIDWAVGLGEDINHWLTLAGYEPIPESLVTETKPDKESILAQLRISATTLSKDDIEAIKEEIDGILDRYDKGTLSTRKKN
jgi:transcriptional regulator with XRE-family HTH domain